MYTYEEKIVENLIKIIIIYNVLLMSFSMLFIDDFNVINVFLCSMITTDCTLANHKRYNLWTLPDILHDNVQIVIFPPLTEI